MTIDITEAEARELIFLLEAEHDRLYWLDTPNPISRKRGRELAAKCKTTITKIKLQLRS